MRWFDDQLSAENDAGLTHAGGAARTEGMCVRERIAESA